MKVNPFTVTSAPAWLLARPFARSLLGSDDGTKSTKGTEELEEHEVQQLARLLGRLLDAAESEPDLYEALPWLSKVSLWELLLECKAEARFPYVRRSFRLSHPSHPPNPSDLWDLPTSVRARTSSHPAVPKSAATLLAFFARVTQPIEEMVEALYLSPLLRDTRTVWKILCRMARDAGVKPLSREVVIALCANLDRNRLITFRQCRPRPHPAMWKITWRSIPTRLQWPVQGPVQQSGQRPSDADNVGGVGRVRNSLLVLVREQITHEAGVGFQQTGKVLAIRCLPDPLDRQGVRGTLGETTECMQTAMTLAFYDALVFSSSRDGEFNRHMRVPTLLRVQTPVPTGIRDAASIWRIRVEEVAAEDELEVTWADRVESVHKVEGLENEAECAFRPEEEWENELAGRVLDPVHYMRILDRGLERTYGYAPLLTKQRVTRCQGWLWSMHPDHDPLLNYTGLQELLPSYPAVVANDGSIEWQGWHYRDYEEDVLSYFPHAQVTVRRSPLAEAVILVYWRGSVLCYAVAEELRHQDGTCRSYWFPYPRLGE